METALVVFWTVAVTAIISAIVTKDARALQKEMKKVPSTDPGGLLYLISGGISNSKVRIYAVLLFITSAKESGWFRQLYSLSYRAVNDDSSVRDLFMVRWAFWTKLEIEEALKDPDFETILAVCRNAYQGGEVLKRVGTVLVGLAGTYDEKMTIVELAHRHTNQDLFEIALMDLVECDLLVEERGRLLAWLLNHHPRNKQVFRRFIETEDDQKRLGLIIGNTASHEEESVWARERLVELDNAPVPAQGD